MRIILADNQQKRSEQLRRILLGEGLTCEADDAVGFEGLPSRLAGGKADLVLVAVDATDEEALAAIRTVHQVTDAPILAAGEGATVQVVREAMRAGAREFIEITRFREELSEILIKIEAEGGVASQRGTLISLYSPNGGSGVSTTAVNLAAREPKYTLNHLCEAWQRLDRKMLASAMVHHGSGVHVLAQASYPEEGGIPENTLCREAVRQLCTLARQMYAVAVADLNHTLDAQQIEAMRLSNLVGLIVRADVPGLRRARWALDTAASMGVARERFRLVLNRYGQSGQVDLAKVEEVLGIKVFQRIPEDNRTANRAVNRGVPVIELSKSSRISRSFSSFARSVKTS